MSLFTSPPHLTRGARWNLLRGKAPIFCWVPLDGKLRVLGGKIVFRRVISRLAHTGQPQPTTQDLTCARHSWPFSQIHHTIR